MRGENEELMSTEFLFRVMKNYGNSGGDCTIL